MAESFFYAVLLGLILGILFDVFRFPRLVLRDKFFFDFLFWIISAIAVFCYLLIFNNGDVRAIYLLFILLGFLLVTFTLGYVTKPVQQKLANKIRKSLKSLKKVLQKLSGIYYNIKAKSGNLTKKKFKGDKNGKGSRKKE